jgi:hypothetical protein
MGEDGDRFCFTGAKRAWFGSFSYPKLFSERIHFFHSLRVSNKQSKHSRQTKRNNLFAASVCSQSLSTILLETEIHTLLWMWIVEGVVRYNVVIGQAGFMQGRSHTYTSSTPISSATVRFSIQFPTTPPPPRFSATFPDTRQLHDGDWSQHQYATSRDFQTKFCASYSRSLAQHSSYSTSHPFQKSFNVGYIKRQASGSIAN